MKVKVGDTLLTVDDEVIYSVLTNKKMTIPKGSKMIVRADNCIMFESNGKLQFLGEDFEMNGYNVEGMASFITNILYKELPMEYCEASKKEIKETIEYALDELGF